MPGTVTSETPSVSLSFANNFWGKDDAGVTPLLDRMSGAKVTGDELKSFYAARTQIEEEYARKLLNLARKPLGSQESGTLRMSLDVVRGEVEAMGKSHQNIAQQMKTELDEQLAAFAGGMKERRKIVQGGIEKLLKLKNQQTATANKARDRYEQDCLKIKGYLAQGHMVMGQEERKNKAKLEKTQIQLSTTRTEYETSIKVLEETTGRWNRDWKIACDKFQDLEEERIDFMKSSLWSFANIASTVCVSDDASCEKIRLSLEDCEVERDISTFIKVLGTGQEIPDPPRFIDFTRGEGSDAASEVSEEDNYSVAQFQRTINPAYRSSSPQPSTFESHHDPDHALDGAQPGSNEPTPRKSISAAPPTEHGYPAAVDDLPVVPHNEYPIDGMTQFCRTGPASDLSSAVSNTRPESRDDHSDYSAPTSYGEPSIGPPSPVKAISDLTNRTIGEPEQQKKRGLFTGRSPFRRKSKGELDRPQAETAAPGNRNTWGPSTARHYGFGNGSPTKQQAPPRYPSPSPDPVDPNANFQLNVGGNVFDVASPDARRGSSTQRTANNSAADSDPIAAALAELKSGAKESTSRISADRYSGIATPGPDVINGVAGRGNRNSQLPDRTRAAPSSYDPPPVSRLGAPQPAFTSRQMQQTTQRYQDQKNNMFNTPPRQNGYESQGSQRPSPQSRPGTSGRPYSRSASPGPMRSASPQPGYGGGAPQMRATSPNPYGGSRSRANSTTPQKPGYGANIPRAVSPSPQYGRPLSRGGGDMAMQLAPSGNSPGSGNYGGQPRGRAGLHNGNRPMSQYGAPPSSAAPHMDNRARSRSTAGGGGRGPQVTRDGRPILHFSRAIYMYQAAIPEELSFGKGDMLAVLRHQDDGWWEAEVCKQPGRVGLVPSNYLAAA